MIVDASVAFKWFVDEDDADRALRLTAFDLFAPDLIYVEVMNALWKKLRRGETLQPLRPIGHMDPLFARVFPVADLASRAGELARELDHPAYDCFYLALAMRENRPLITADRRFLKRCGSSAYADVTYSLTDWNPE